MSDNTKYKFVIVSPRQNGGGSIVLHVLCKMLSELGYDAKIYYLYRRANGFRQNGSFSKPIWLLGTLYDSFLLFLSCTLPNHLLQSKEIFMGYVDTSVQGCKRKYLPCIDDNTIVVYPETIYGNPLNAKNVVRWLLYYNLIYNQEHPDSYDEKDLFYCYREIFNDYKLNPLAKTLCISYYNLDLYKRYNYGTRAGNCYIIRKGAGRKDLPEHFDGVVIDNLPETEKVKQFNNCEYCISYDMQSAYTLIAALCGCVSVLIPEEGKKREDYRKPEEWSYGEAFGFTKEELEYAKATRDKVYECYRTSNEAGKERVKAFAEDCLAYFTELADKGQD